MQLDDAVAGAEGVLGARRQREAERGPGLGQRVEVVRGKHEMVDALHARVRSSSAASGSGEATGSGATAIRRHAVPACRPAMRITYADGWLKRIHLTCQPCLPICRCKSGTDMSAGSISEHARAAISGAASRSACRWWWPRRRSACCSARSRSTTAFRSSRRSLMSASDLWRRQPDGRPRALRPACRAVADRAVDLRGEFPPRALFRRRRPAHPRTGRRCSRRSASSSSPIRNMPRPSCKGERGEHDHLRLVHGHGAADLCLLGRGSLARRARSAT